jgi:hypothetical protein
VELDAGLVLKQFSKPFVAVQDFREGSAPGSSDIIQKYDGQGRDLPAAIEKEEALRIMSDVGRGNYAKGWKHFASDNLHLLMERQWYSTIPATDYHLFLWLDTW